MATKELINTKVEEFEGTELLLYLNDKTKHNFSDFALAIMGLGVGVAGTHLEKKVASEIAKKLCPILAAMGYALTVSEIISMIQDNIDARELEEELKQLDVATGTLRVTTKTYMWLSSSGNHSAYTTDVTYKAL